MKKLLVILAIVLLPLSAFAGMSAITDSEMSAVTGQMGVSIAIVDQQQDLTLASLTWGDVNTSFRYVAGQATDINPGYINLNDIALIKNTTTLYGLSSPLGVVADPLKIDVASFGALGTNMPFGALANHTAVIISLSDSVQTIDEIRIGSITLDSTVADAAVYVALQNGSTSSTVALGSHGGSNTAVTNFYEYLNSGGKYMYQSACGSINSHQLGQLYIRGFRQIGYSHLEGYNSNTGTLNVAKRPGYIAIWAHDQSGL